MEYKKYIQKYWYIPLIIIGLLMITYYNSNNDKKIFLTYGDDKFKKSRKRIIREAKSLNLFDDTILETDKTILNDREFKKCLSSPYFNKIFNEKRGGGYWIWKPYIIQKTLNNMKNGDILVYSDAGCVINNNDDIKTKFIEIFNDLNNDRYNMLLNSLSNKHNEKIWSKGDVLKYHNVYNNEKILNEGQYESGRIILIKNDITMEIINKWWEIAKNNPQLFDDSESKIPNKNEFKENRHDQSNMSILCKLNNKCIGGDLKFIDAQRKR